MHYTLVHGDPPKTSGPLIPFLWLFCLRSIPLLIPDLPHCCPINLPDGTQPLIKLPELCINDSLLLCSDLSLAYWCSHVISITLSLSHFWYITQLMTHSHTNQSCHAAYSFLLIPCLLIAYKALTKPLPITYQSLTNSAYSLPFLYFNAVSPHVFKPLGSAQWKKSPIVRNYPSLSLPQSVSPQLLESCRLQWRSKGSDIQVLSNLFKSKYFSRLKQSLACQSFISHCFWTSGAPLPLCCTNL